MANNRMYLCCVRCVNDEEVKADDCLHYFAKYYPTPGWYLIGDDPWATVGDFLEKHSHGTMYGQDIAIVYEDIFEAQVSKRRILDAVADVRNGSKR